MKRTGASAHEGSSTVDHGDAAAGKRSLTVGLAGGARGSGPTAPVLQLKPAGEGEALSGDESYVDSLLGGDGKARADSGGGDEDWMQQGEPVPHKGAYTEADRDRLLKALKDRTRHNRREAGELLGEYVDASVSIVAKYAMDSVKEKDQLAGFIKFCLAESAAAIAGGIPALLGKKAAEAVLSKAADYIAGESMEDAEVFQDEKDMRALIDRMAEHTGDFVEAMVAGLGADEVSAAFWLGKAKPEDFHRFRIPERFECPKKEQIRAAVAATVASKHHRRKIGGQMLQGPEYIETDEVERRWDNNIVEVDISAKGGVVKPIAARFKTNSKTLREEIVGKATLETLENVALHIQVTGDTHEQGIKKVLEALRRGAIEANDEATFAKHYPPESGPLVITRMPPGDGGAFGSKGGNLAEHLVLYQWATGDEDLSALAHKINGVEEDDEGQSSRIGYHPADHLAERVKTEMTMSRLYGAHLIANAPAVTSLVPKG